MNILLYSDKWIYVLLSWCVGVLLSLLMRKGFGMSGFEWPTYENKDQLYDDSPGTFLGELFAAIDSKCEKPLFTIELIDTNLDELISVWKFSQNTDCSQFGIRWLLSHIKERIAMKHAVKLVAYVETEETDLKKSC